MKKLLVMLLLVAALLGAGWMWLRTPIAETSEAALAAFPIYSITRARNEQLRRIAHRAFALARTRRGLVTSVDKANVLDTSRMWRRVVSEVAEEYPDVELRHHLVDSVAMELVTAPAQFDVLPSRIGYASTIPPSASNRMALAPPASSANTTVTSLLHARIQPPSSAGKVAAPSGNAGHG